MKWEMGKMEKPGIPLRVYVAHTTFTNTEFSRSKLCTA